MDERQRAMFRTDDAAHNVALAALGVDRMCPGEAWPEHLLSDLRVALSKYRDAVAREDEMARVPSSPEGGHATT